LARTGSRSKQAEPLGYEETLWKAGDMLQVSLPPKVSGSQPKTSPWSSAPTTSMAENRQLGSPSDNGDR
jgi:hypothetical protein